MYRRATFPLILGAGGAAVLIALGVWQVQRLEWKQGVLQRIESRIYLDAVPIPLRPDPLYDNYLAVKASGRIDGRELSVLLSRTGYGPGYRIIAPFETAGRRILVDRGFVPQSHLNDARRDEEVSIEGNLLWPDEVDRMFTPAPEGDLWFARDVAAMADAVGAEDVLVVVRKSTGKDPNLYPWPVDTTGIPNDHREYAITWFSLAAVWLGMTGFWLWRIRRHPGA